MSNLIRLSPTGIEYGDYAWNFASGCGNNIDGKCKAGGFKCWAYSISQRFKGHYPNGFKPTIYPEALLSPLYLRKPSRILCAFMGDLFWDCPEFDPWREITLRGKDGRVFFEGSLRDRIIMTIDQCPQHTFLFLTKQPQNLIKFDFPDNCWVGVTITNDKMRYAALYWLKQIQAKVKFLSIEPHLGRIEVAPIDLQDAGVGWIIDGAQTNPYKPPKIEWVQEIVQAADKAGIPVFLKNNLMPLVGQKGMLVQAGNIKYGLRQEMPEG